MCEVCRIGAMVEWVLWVATIIFIALIESPVSLTFLWCYLSIGAAIFIVDQFLDFTGWYRGPYFTFSVGIIVCAYPLFILNSLYAHYYYVEIVVETGDGWEATRLVKKTNVIKSKGEEL